MKLSAIHIPPPSAMSNASRSSHVTHSVMCCNRKVFSTMKITRLMSVSSITMNASTAVGMSTKAGTKKNPASSTSGTNHPMTRNATEHSANLGQKFGRFFARQANRQPETYNCTA